MCAWTQARARKGRAVRPPLAREHDRAGVWAGVRSAYIRLVLFNGLAALQQLLGKLSNFGLAAGGGGGRSRAMRSLTRQRVASVHAGACARAGSTRSAPDIVGQLHGTWTVNEALDKVDRDGDEADAAEKDQCDPPDQVDHGDDVGRERHADAARGRPRRGQSVATGYAPGGGGRAEGAMGRVSGHPRRGGRAWAVRRRATYSTGPE